MTIIGTFTKAADGSFHGQIRTLTVNAKAVDIDPVPRAGETAPDHRVTAGPSEIGAAWTVTRPGQPDALSVRLDDPSFASPVSALLVQTEAPDGYALRWTRRKRA